MKRFGYFVVLMMVSPPAYAGESLSFVVGGHRIHIEAPRNCRSASCVAVSIPGIYETRRDRDDDADAAPAKPLAAAPVPVVEACAFGKFYCTGNVWSRIDAAPEKLISSTQESSPPRS